MFFLGPRDSGDGDGSFNPSRFTIWVGTKSKTGYSKIDLGEKYKGNKKILICCTDDGKMTMENGKVFNTGNHPIETFGPMLYLHDAGFTFEVATTSGNAVVFEMWAYPTKDEHVKALHEEYRTKFESPVKISDITSIDDYVAIFIPGGHGAMLNLPDNAALGDLLHLAHAKSLPTVTLCHGPSALLSTGRGDKAFAYDGYETTCFTDKTDAFTPKVGYLPGPMPWKCQASLEEKGMKVVNAKETGATHVDRELITGDSPDAAIALGKLAAPLILKYARENNL